MRGHGKIIEARMAGKKPPFVFLNDYPCKTDWFEFGEHATVSTDGDPLANLDLRFLVGLAVSISATSEHRAKALYERAKAAGAATIAACHINTHEPPWNQTGWFEIYRKESSNG